MMMLASILLRPYLRRAWGRIPFDERVAGTNTAFWFVVTALTLAFVTAWLLQVTLPARPPASPPGTRLVGGRA